MAIKIAGTTVIDDSRNIQNIGIITATSFVGDGSGLTGAGSTVFIDTTTNQEFFPLFTSTTSGTITASGISTSKLKFNPSTGTVTATKIAVGSAVTISSSGINVVGIITASSDIQIGTKSVATTGKAIAMAMVFG